MQYAGNFSGSTPVVKKYKASATGYAAGIVMLRSASNASGQMSISTTTSGADALGLLMDTGNNRGASITYSTTQGDPEAVYSVIVNPDQILRAQMVTGATGTAITGDTIVTASSNGLTWVGGTSVASPDMDEGIVWYTSGANVGRHMRWEKANKRNLLEWKNIQLMREPHSDDPDLANFERLRPVGAQDRFRGDAQINGVMSYRSVPQENWDTAFQGKGPDSALEQAKRVSTEQHGNRPRNPMTEEQRRAVGERLAKARAAKAQKQNPLNEVDHPATIQEGEQAPMSEGSR